MSVNSSSPLSVLPPSSPSNSSIFPFYMMCRNSVPRMVLYTTYTAISVCLFPLYTFILLLGLQRWRRQRSMGTTMSHSDFFTYNMMFPEMLCGFGAVAFVVGSYTNSEPMTLLGLYSVCVVLPGQTLFHALTCVDRYLAVVHPVAYMCRRETQGVRIRNVSTACVWLLCAVWLGLIKLYLPNFPTVIFCSFITLCSVVIFVCCLSVLRALARPGPGEVDNHRGQVDQSKQRAFLMILAIMVTLHLRFVGLLVGFGIRNGPSMSLESFCVLVGSGVFLTMPSSLVLPLLFLHRAGKHLCCGKNTESEQKSPTETRKN